MPKGHTYGHQVKPPPNSLAHITQRGPSSSALGNFLYPFAWRDVVFWFDDFTQRDAANIADHYTLGTDACATAFTESAGINGLLAGATGAADCGAIAILTSADWKGDLNAGQEMRWQVSSVASAHLEQGFTDPLGDNTLGAFDGCGAAANCATDVAVIRLCTDCDCAGYFTTVGTSCFGTDCCGCFGWSPTAAAFLATRIQLETNMAHGYAFDACHVLKNASRFNDGGSESVNKVEGGTSLTSRLFVQTLAACASKTATIDYWALWMDRR